MRFTSHLVLGGDITTAPSMFIGALHASLLQSIQ